MSESPERRVARLEAELARAKVVALERELAATRLSGAGLRAVAPLAPPPREVPLAYRLVATPFGVWPLALLALVTVVPTALWMAAPTAAIAVTVASAAAVTLRLLRAAALRRALLRWGEVAQVVDVSTLSRGTWLAGSAAARRMRVDQARGWTVERIWYGGPMIRTRVGYELRGTAGSLVLRGPEYAGGVILADSRDPRRALCVSSFPYPLERDETGNWTGRVPPAVLGGAAAMAALLVGWTAGTVWLWACWADLLTRYS